MATIMAAFWIRRAMDMGFGASMALSRADCKKSSEARRTLTVSRNVSPKGFVGDGIIFESFMDSFYVCSTWNVPPGPGREFFRARRNTTGKSTYIDVPYLLKLIDVK